MKTTYLIPALLIGSLSLAAPALAGEGNGDPFAFRANGVTTQLRAGAVGSIQNPFPFAAPGTPGSTTAQQDVGSVHGYDTANSLPDSGLDTMQPRTQVAGH